jgi:uncharacterized protein (TIGR03546 family)
MFSAIVAAFRSPVRALLASNSNGQLAAGFTLGMIIGFMPKGNLIALSLCVLLFSLRCNKGLAILAAIVFSCAGAWTDPFAHKLGLAALSLQPLQATYASIFNLPLGPWLGFNNTLVAGSFLLALYLAYPVYWAVGLIASAVRAIAAPRPVGCHAALQSGGAP